MKHHIVDWWKQNGLETEESDVYRVEIRITNAKTLKNSTSGKLFKLQASDLLLQEQIENLFAAFASKYFRFYHRRDISHLERMPEVKIFCHGKKPILKPLHVRGRKDYTRQTKITLNWLDKQIYANAKEDNVFTHSLLDVKNISKPSIRWGNTSRRKTKTTGRKRNHGTPGILPLTDGILCGTIRRDGRRPVRTGGKGSRRV